MTAEPKNLLRTECKHIRSGDLPALESLQLQAIFTTREPIQEGFIYIRGPDTIQLCAFCAGRLLAILSADDYVGLQRD